MNAKAHTAELAEKLETFNEEFHRREMGSDYRMLSPWIKEMALVSALENLPEGTRPFAQMVYTVNKGSRNKERGIIGEGLGTVYDHLIKAVEKVGFVKIKPGEKILIENAIPVLLTTIIASITIISGKGVGSLPGKEKGDFEESRLFSFELLLHMGISAGLLRDTYSVLMEASGSPDEKQEAAVDIVTLFTLVLILFVAAECGNLNLEKLLERMKDHLLHHIERVSTYLDEAIATRNIDNRIATELNIALEQAKLRLADDDIESFLEACTGALKAVGVSRELWKKDLQQAGEYSNKLLALIREGGENNISGMTGFFQAG